MAPRSVVAPNFGLYLDRPPIAIPARGLKNGYNFRIKNGVLSNLNLGWEKFYADGVTLGSRVQAIVNFIVRDGTEHLVFFTVKDIIRHDPGLGLPVYLTPVYVTGTASASGTAVTGTGTAWNTNSNAEPGDFIHFGDANFNTVDATEWFEIASVETDTGLTLTTDAGTVVDGPYTIRKVFEGQARNIWSVDSFLQDEDSGDDLLIATNGADPVVSWNGDDDTVTVHTELGFTAAALSTFANMMIYINVQVSGIAYPTSIINSDIGKPLAAGSVGVGLSEQFRITDQPEELLGGLVLGNNLLLYSRRQGIVTQFAGDPLIFIFRVAFSGVGPVGPRAIVDFGNYHEFYGADSEYAFDGVALREVNTHVGRDVIRTADPIRRPFTYGHFDEENGDLIWSVPGTEDPEAGAEDGAPATAWSEHYLETVPPGVERPYSKRAWPFTAAGNYTRNTGLTWNNAAGTWAEYNYAWNDQFFSLAFPITLVGDTAGVIYIANQTQQGDGVDLASFVRTGRMPLDDGKMRALLSRIYPFTGQLSESLNITTFLADFATTTATNGGTLAYDTSHVEGRFFVTPYRRARYIEVQFGSPGTPWTLEGWDFEVKSGGRR